VLGNLIFLADVLLRSSFIKLEEKMGPRSNELICGSTIKDECFKGFFVSIDNSKKLLVLACRKAINC
jgi:hypothetical protein